MCVCERERGGRESVSVYERESVCVCSSNESLLTVNGEERDRERECVCV